MTACGTEAAGPPDTMPDGYPRYISIPFDKLEYHGGGMWSVPSTGSAGSEWFSAEYDCNPICGCHLADKCVRCRVCTSCDGCYCGED